MGSGHKLPGTPCAIGTHNSDENHHKLFWQLQEGSTETTKSDISILQTATSKGVGAEVKVIVYTSETSYGNDNANANTVPEDPNDNANGSGFGSSSGYVIAKGPNAIAYTRSDAYGQGREADPNGANGSGSGSGGGTTIAYGRTGPPP